jgi:hypothetical protein
MKGGKSGNEEATNEGSEGSEGSDFRNALNGSLLPGIRHGLSNSPGLGFRICDLTPLSGISYFAVDSPEADEE